MDGAGRFIPDPARAEPGTRTAVDCGCLMWVQDEVFVFLPCSPRCEVYAYFRRACAEQGKIPGMIIDPGN